MCKCVNVQMCECGNVQICKYANEQIDKCRLKLVVAKPVLAGCGNLHDFVKTSCFK